MNSSSRMIRTAAVLALSLVITSVISAEPQSKRRAVKPGSGTSGAVPGQPTALLTGTILDATTNAPVVGVIVQIGPAPAAPMPAAISSSDGSRRGLGVDVCADGLRPVQLDGHDQR